MPGKTWSLPCKHKAHAAAHHAMAALGDGRETGKYPLAIISKGVGFFPPTCCTPAAPGPCSVSAAAASGLLPALPAPGCCRCCLLIWRGGGRPASQACSTCTCALRLVTRLQQYCYSSMDCLQGNMRCICTGSHQEDEQVPDHASLGASSPGKDASCRQSHGALRCRVYCCCNTGCLAILLHAVCDGVSLLGGLNMRLAGGPCCTCAVRAVRTAHT